MPYFPKPHPSQRAPRLRVCELTHVVFVYGQGMQIRGRLYDISRTGGSAEMEVPLPPSTLVHLSVRTPSGNIEAIAEMLSAVTAKRQPFRFIALDEPDRDKLHRLVTR